MPRARRRIVTVAQQRWVSTEAGRHLAGRVKEHTTPEVALRRALHAAGARFRLHPRLAKGCTPDLVLPRWGLAVFVDGCFFHSCPTHGRQTPWTGPNAALWEEKMRRNTERDTTSTALAQGLGWVVVRVWEHEVTTDPAATAARVLTAAPAPAPPATR
jgi:DNA mismatch endonuclease (patch repair protein)